MIADLRNERIALTARVNDRDMRIAWLKNEIYRLRSRIDDAWRCLNPVGQLARHYIDAAAADGDGWRNLKVQAEADVSMVVEATAAPPTVSDLLRVLPVVEWRDRNGHWHQSRADKTRYWSRELVRWTGWVASAHLDEHALSLLPARLVPAFDADADPATRGPIDGSGGGA